MLLMKRLILAFSFIAKKRPDYRSHFRENKSPPLGALVMVDLYWHLYGVQDVQSLQVENMKMEYNF